SWSPTIPPRCCAIRGGRAPPGTTSSSSARCSTAAPDVVCRSHTHRTSLNPPETLALPSEATETGYDRRPPFSAEAEISVLGGMLIARAAVARAIEPVNDSMFFREAHRRLFRAMARLFERGDVIDVITVNNELTKTGELEGIGGIEYIAQLLDA